MLTETPAGVNIQLHETRRQAPHILMRAYLELFRIYLVPTAIADSFAGFALAAAIFDRTEEPLSVLIVAVISACLYSFGMTCNDIFDLEKDREDAPAKPLPSGAIPPARAARLAAALGALAIGLAFLAPGAFWPAAAVVICSLLYNIGAKNIPVLGDLLMGSCRSGNFLIGATAAGGSFLAVLAECRLLAPALILGGFIAVVTAISRLEDGPHRPHVFHALTFPLLIIPISLVALNHGSLLNGIANLGLLVFLFRAILRARRARAPVPNTSGPDRDTSTIGKIECESPHGPLHPATAYVRSALGSLILFDAALLLAFTPHDTTSILPAAALCLLALFAWWWKRNWLQSGGADT